MQNSRLLPMLFRRNIEELLLFTVSSEYEMGKMLEDRNDPLWRDQKMEDELRRRLTGSNEYECFMSEVQTVYTLLEKLCSMLKIEPGQVRLVSACRYIN